MTEREMQKDLLAQYYENTKHRLDTADEEKKQEILTKACSIFAMSLERIPCPDEG